MSKYKESFEIPDGYMPLFEVPRNTIVEAEDGTRIHFHHIDGMYSHCTVNGHVIHFIAWMPVKPIGP